MSERIKEDFHNLKNDVMITAEDIKEETEESVSKKTKRGIERLNDMLDKAQSFTSEKLEQLADSLEN
jgi:hypothetical protein